MVDPATAITASTIATLAFQKFIESGAGKLAEKFTETAIAKMDELRKKIIERLGGKSPNVDQVIAKAEQGDHLAIENIGDYLKVAMLEYPDFADEIKLLAQQIKAGKIQDNSNMIMDISGYQATGYQTKSEVTGGENYTGNITINKYTGKPDS